MGHVMEFFEERREQSIVKSRIVSKYFAAWSKVIDSTQKRFGRGDKIGYIDLYAGPGRYRDGTASTPLAILEYAIKNPHTRNKLVCLLNDGDAKNASTLNGEISKLPGIENLQYPPKILNKGVEADFETMFESAKTIPLFTFLDPFGYVGLSLKLVNSVIKSWGCDAVFFFNYSRINAGLTNSKVEKHIDALFGSERANRMRAEVLSLQNSYDRELYLMENFSQALREIGGEYVLPFKFKRDETDRTSHFLVFVCKDFKGYEIMKSIMFNESSRYDQGVASFSYSKADERFPLLFSLSRPLDQLAVDLPLYFQGRTLSVRELYREHSVNRPFVISNYKDVLRTLEEQSKVLVEPENRPVRNGVKTMADRVEVSFPKVS